MITVPVWLQVISVALLTIGYWKAGDGWRYGWLISAINTALWTIFGILTRQWAILLGPVTLGVVNVRNFFRTKRRSDEAQHDLELT